MSQEFPIVPPSGAAWWVFLIVAVPVILILAIFLSRGHEKFVVSNDGLKIAALFYGRSIAAKDLDVGNARTLDLSRDTDYRLTLRTNGTGLPGYAAGWFKMANGGKALAFVTDRSRVVYIPTRQDYSLMLSVADPNEFLRVLRTEIKAESQPASRP